MNMSGQMRLQNPGFLAVWLIFCFSAIACAETMSLSDCIDFALEHSRELRKREIEQTNSRLATRIKRGKFAYDIKSSVEEGVSGEISGSVTLNKEIVGGVDVSSVYRNSEEDAGDNFESFSVRISKVILGGGSVRESRLDIDNSLIGQIISLNKMEKYKRQLRSLVQAAYYRVVRNMQTLKVWELRVARAGKNLEHALEREDPLDIATARIEVPETEASLSTAKREIASSLDSLKELMGMDMEEDLEITGDFDFSEYEFDLTCDIAFCLENHEDIINAGLERKKIENTARVKGSKVWPEVSLWVKGETEINPGGSSDLEEEEDDDPDYSGGISMSWEILSSTARAEHKKLLNDLKVSDINIRSVRQGKVREVRDMGGKLREALLLVRLQEKKLEHNRRIVELYSDRWRNGEIDILEYIRSQNDMENTRIQLIKQKTTYMELLGTYLYVTGR